jgi:putative ABC transport system permease protein
LLTESGPYSLPGAQFWVISLHSVHGSIAPIIAAGRAPNADDEVALGRLTMRALGKHIGDSINLPTLTSNGPVTEVGPYRIVGESVMASIDPAVGPGTGALVTDAGRLRIDPSDDPYLVVRASPKVPQRTVVTDLAARFGTDVTVPQPQDDLRNIVQISSTPWTIAALLALLALASAAHALITSVRRRRREFAILRSLGFTSGQVVQAVSWRAALIGLCAAVIGIPIGVLAGGWAWRLVARQIGLDTVAEMNTDAIWLAAVGALVATVALSVGPGIVAGRRRLVDALRSE